MGKLENFNKTMSRFDSNNSTRFIIYLDFYKPFSLMIENIIFKILL